MAPLVAEPTFKTAMPSSAPALRPQSRDRDRLGTTYDRFMNTRNSPEHSAAGEELLKAIFQGPNASGQSQNK